MVINNYVVIPVVARPGVVAMGTKLNASISGWDNNTWDLSDWYKDA
jgi:peptide/nickel transport system substrate-binding protein